MPSLTRLVQTTAKFLSDNSPSILTGIAVAGVVSTTVLAVKATPAANEMLARARWNRLIENGTPVPITDEMIDSVQLGYVYAIKAAWTPYIPALLVGGVTIACIIGANSISLKRQAVLVGAYTLAEAYSKDYRDQVEKTFGKAKEKGVRDSVAQKHLEENPVSDNTIILTGNGKVLCYDDWSGRYFESDAQAIKKAQNEINEECFNNSYASLNDFYAALKLPNTGGGDEFGWTMDNKLDVHITTKMAEDERPCLVLTFNRSPIRDYFKLGG